MDDKLFKKIKIISNFISFYKTFFFISSITTVLISFIMQSLLEEDKFYINNFLENWKKRPITDYKISMNNCEEGYENSNLGYWPLSTNLCDCSESFFYKGSRTKSKIKPYQCSLLLGLIGCKNSEQMMRININQWKGKNICIKRQKNSYLETLMQNKENCECNLVDSFNKKVCSEECPINNGEISKLSSNNDTKRKFKKRKEFQSQIKQIKQFRTFGNFTTFIDIENIYNKNFNIIMNNEILNNYAASEIIISENYPCLIRNNVHRVNEVYRLYDFILENIDYIKSTELGINKTERFSLPSSHNSDEFKINLFNEINLKTLDQKDCIFYENSYFDRRHYVIDVVNFYQFLLSDLNENSFKYKNLTLSYEDMSEINNFTPTTTMFLLSSPFYGWNYDICREDPSQRMNKILSLYDSAWVTIMLVVLLKIICFIYLTIYGIFEKFYAESYFVIYFLSSIESNKNNNQMTFDIIYYFFNIISLCGLIQICFTLKNIVNFQYLYMIRNDCLDENSTKLMTYLYDVCEEKFIYCVFMMTFNAIEFTFFTLIFKNSYELKLIIK